MTLDQKIALAITAARQVMNDSSKLVVFDDQDPDPSGFGVLDSSDTMIGTVEFDLDGRPEVRPLRLAPAQLPN